MTIPTLYFGIKINMAYNVIFWDKNTRNVSTRLNPIVLDPPIKLGRAATLPILDGKNPCPLLSKCSNV